MKSLTDPPCAECGFAILPDQPWVQGTFGRIHALCDDRAEF